MHEATVVSFQAHQQFRDMDPQSRAGLIIGHINRLAEDAGMARSRTDTADFVRRAIAARRKRERLFSADLFADPAWDILLELYLFECEQRRTSVSKLCIAAAVPPTTALRWIDKLQEDGLLERAPDPLDARRTWVSISQAGFRKMTAYFASLSNEDFPL